MQKVLWLEFTDPSAWQSFNTLKENYLTHYREVCGTKLEVHKLTWSSFEDQAFFRDLKKCDPHKIILADIRFDMNLWLPLLFESLPDVEIEVHLYGNPIERMKRLLKLSSLENRTLSFVVGSKVQSRVLSNILKNPGNCKYLPFVSHDQTEEVTTKPEGVYLYAGRISHQKNVLPLIDIFREAFSDSDLAELLIAGAPDNVGLPSCPPGNYLDYTGERFFTQLEKIKESKPRINYLGQLSREHIARAYAKASHFVSLSTFEGEDFGLSVCEALSRGLSCTLSMWGGFQEFQNLPQVYGCQIQLQDESLGIDKSEVFEALKRKADPVASKKIFEAWMVERREYLKHQIQLNQSEKFAGFKDSFIGHAQKKMTGEFFVHDQEFLSPYWETSSN